MFYECFLIWMNLQHLHLSNDQWTSVVIKNAFHCSKQPFEMDRADQFNPTRPDDQPRTGSEIVSEQWAIRWNQYELVQLFMDLLVVRVNRPHRRATHLRTHLNVYEEVESLLKAQLTLHQPSHQDFLIWHHHFPAFAERNPVQVQAVGHCCPTKVPVATLRTQWNPRSNVHLLGRRISLSNFSTILHKLNSRKAR